MQLLLNIKHMLKEHEKTFAFFIVNYPQYLNTILALPPYISSAFSVQRMKN